MFSAAKDLLTSKAAKAFVNERIKNYGRVEEFAIDSKRRRIDLVCNLHGEVSAIGVTIEQYELRYEDGKTFIEVLSTTATRAWMESAMRDHLHGRKFELPPWAAAAL